MTVAERKRHKPRPSPETLKEVTECESRLATPRSGARFSLLRELVINKHVLTPTARGVSPSLLWQNWRDAPQQDDRYFSLSKRSLL
jgi:hypothetical protein